MPNNSTEDQDNQNTPPPTTEDDTQADNAPAANPKNTNAPKPQVTTNPSIKNY